MDDYKPGRRSRVRRVPSGDLAAAAERLIMLMRGRGTQPEIRQASRPAILAARVVERMPIVQDRRPREVAVPAMSPENPELAQALHGERERHADGRGDAKRGGPEPGGCGGRDLLARAQDAAAALATFPFALPAPPTFRHQACRSVRRLADMSRVRGM